MARQSSSIPAKWLKLFALIPGYDPLSLAGDCRFDSAAAELVCEFFSKCLKHSKGTKAGEPFKLESWQQAVTGCLFGWKRPDGTRRYRECLLYVAKKNGKSAWVAGLVIYVMLCDHELGAELYSAAASRDQAALIFSHAVGMVKQEAELSSRLRVYGAAGGTQSRSITYEGEMSSYKCLSADANTADGSSPHFAAIDELHRHKSAELSDVLQKSTAARRQPMVVYTTTADSNRPSACNTKLKYAKQVRDNKGDPSQPGHDPSFLPVIYEADKDDDWESPDTWRKANPNMGVTIPESFLKRECQKALETPSELNNFLRLHLNIVTDADEAWLDMSSWDGCGTEDDPKAWRAAMLLKLRGRPCRLALDLGSTNDLTALVALFPDDENTVIPWFWMPRDNARKRELSHRVPYSTWARDGFLDMTEGNFVDQSFVLAKALECVKVFGAKEIAVDRYMARQITDVAQREGVTVVEFGQGFRDMSEPSKRLETLVLSGKLRHGNNPILRWMAGNTTINRDPAGNIKPDKAKSAEKIDGIVALVMALGRSMVAVPDTESVYAKRARLSERALQTI